MLKPLPCQRCGAPVYLMKSGKMKADGKPQWITVEMKGVTDDDVGYDWKRHTPHWKVCTSQDSIDFRARLEREKNAQANPVVKPKPPEVELEF